MHDWENNGVDVNASSPFNKKTSYKEEVRAASRLLRKYLSYLSESNLAESIRWIWHHKCSFRLPRLHRASPSTSLHKRSSYPVVSAIPI